MSTVMREHTAEAYAAQTAEQALDRLAQAARPDVVFGQPIERGEVTVIPCCEIALGLGMGGGTGTNPAAGKAEKAGGEGLGAGGGARGRPVAIVLVTREAVRVVPIVDATKVALAALTTAGFMAFWIARLVGASRGRAAGGRLIGPGGRSWARTARALAAARRLPRAR